MQRRHLLTSLAATALMPFAAHITFANEGPFEVTRTDVEWRAMLTDLEYEVMREESTEPAESSTLNKIY